jgi:hypothetical protein
VNRTGSAFVNAKKSDFHDLLQPLVMVQIGGGKASVRSVDDVADVIAGRNNAGASLGLNNAGASQGLSNAGMSDYLPKGTGDSAIAQGMGGGVRRR